MKTISRNLVLIIFFTLLISFGSTLQSADLARGEALDFPPPLEAHWIWDKDSDPFGYNQAIVARKSLRLDKFENAEFRITADSYYRLYINGRWVNDGPCRSWPEHFQYDVVNLAPYLVKGSNQIVIYARYFGVGDFHHVPKQAGLMAQLDVRGAKGNTWSFITDSSWETALVPALVANTPKVSIQMEPCELWDARLEDNLKFKKASVLFSTNDGPWRDLNPRDVALLNLKPFSFKSFIDAKRVRAEGHDFCLPAARLANPGLIEANHTVNCAGGMATLLHNDKELTLNLQADGLEIAVDGQRKQGNQFKLEPGTHLVLGLVRDMFTHQKEKSLRIRNLNGFRLENPIQAGHENPWCYLPFPEFNVATNDFLWMSFRRDNPHLAKLLDGYANTRKELLAQDKDSFLSVARDRAQVLPSDKMFVQDIHWQFLNRQVMGDARGLVHHPSGLIHDNPETTNIHPGDQGDIELLYDLGEQNCGYYQFELMAEAGVVLDIFSLEYIAPDGRIQHSWGNRNGIRYITKEGLNRFTSLKRRSGRYVFVTLRNFKSPVEIRHLQIVESTYPVNYRGDFACSDARLGKIWEISTRTLKLCMEDTYTDCPLYEQTLWVGDARNESLLAYGVFGAEDLARRCIRIAAQSLDLYPIVGCQTPSSWDVLIPAWSLLWGISTWDYYWATGDTDFLREIFPAVIQNLQGTEQFINKQNLFSAPFWNFFDWTPIDAGHRTVTYNTMFVIGAIDAALQVANVLDDHVHDEWLRQYRSRLVQGVNQLWDPARNAYPDSIHEDGSASGSTCQHTSFLSILYDIIPEQHHAAAVRNLTEPPEKMVKIGSPFAMLYLYETYEKLGMDDAIIDDIYKAYLPMVESGATTVWESFPSGTTGSGGFPTRSHSHAWSSAPSRYLNRIILGIKETAPGAASVEISPRLSDLTWARGKTATPRGPVSVTWKLEDKNLTVTYTAPKGVKAAFVRNDTHERLTITVNGKPWKGSID